MPVSIEMTNNFTFKCFIYILVVERILSKTPLKLAGRELLISPFIQEPMIRISGISSQISVDTLELFFENTKRSGGGDIESIQMVEADEAAIITFADKSGSTPLNTSFRNLRLPWCFQKQTRKSVTQLYR